MKFVALAALLSLAAVGCIPSTAILPYDPPRAVSRSYTVGEVRTVSVGDPIVEVSNGKLIPVYTALFDYQPPDMGFTNSPPPLRKGHRLPVVGVVPDGGLVIYDPNYRNAGGIVITDSGYARCWIGTEANLRGLKYAEGEFTTDRLFARAPNAEAAVAPGFFRAQLLYAGVTGTTVKLIYREFAEEYLRPAFTTELQYDLASGRSIAYKSLRIDIEEATNASARFKVTDDGGLPWLP